MRYQSFFLIGTLRGGNYHKHPLANVVYLGVLDAIDMPGTIIDKPNKNLADVGVLSPDAHRLPAHGVLFTRDLVRGSLG
jgi:hypothetical protein